MDLDESTSLNGGSATPAPLIDLTDNHGIQTSGATRSIPVTIAATNKTVQQCYDEIKAQFLAITAQLTLSQAQTPYEDLEYLRDLRNKKYTDMQYLMNVIKNEQSVPAVANPSTQAAIIPSNLPHMQWIGAVFDESRPVDNHWFRLMPPLLSHQQREWFKDFVDHFSASAKWETFKAAITNRYGVSASEDCEDCTNKLRKIVMSSSEDIDSFNDRFRDLCRRAGVHNEVWVRNQYREAIPPSINDKMVTILLMAKEKKRNSIDRMMNIAKEIYHKWYKNRLGKNQTSSTRASRRSRSRSPVLVSSRSSAPAASSSRHGTYDSRQASRNRNNGSRRIHQNRQPEVYCSFHKSSTHSDENCEALAKARETGSQPKRRAARGECRICYKPWSPQHVCDNAVPTYPPAANLALRHMEYSPDNAQERASNAWAMSTPAVVAANTPVVSVLPPAPAPVPIAVEMDIDSDTQINIQAQYCYYRKCEMFCPGGLCE